MIRLGLCCTFLNEPIKFSHATAAFLLRQPAEVREAKLAAVSMQNARSLQAAIRYCSRAGIGSFRITSQILPLKTHPRLKYELAALPDGEAIRREFLEAGKLAEQCGIRLTFHPDQFVVLNSLRDEVVEASRKELEYQAEVAEWIGADVIMIHGGAGRADKAASLLRFGRALERLSDRVRSRLVVENDDVVYTPEDLLPLCRSAQLPLVYDVHHHRCNADRWSVEEATERALGTWNREPLFHISSPINGWSGKHPRRHHDFIDPADFPAPWRSLSLTIEVEAKAKEQAVQALAQALRERSIAHYQPTACGLESTLATQDFKTKPSRGRRIH